MILYIIIGIGALLLGGGGVWFLSNTVLKSRTQNIIAEAENEAKVLKDKKMLEVKEKFISMKNDYDLQVNQRNSKLQQAEARMRQREQQVNQLQSEAAKSKAENDSIRDNLKNQQSILEQRKQELEKFRHQENERLEVISGYSAAEAKEKLIESMKEEAKTDAMAFVNEIMEEAKMNAN